jgi:hypothetical protein
MLLCTCILLKFESIGRKTASSDIASASAISETSSPAVTSVSRNVTGATERPASASPPTDRSEANRSQESASVTPKIRSVSGQPLKRRTTLRSVVPDSAELKPINRPDKGGQLGRSIDIYTNHFPVLIGNAIVHQYDVEVCMLGRDGRHMEARKDERWEMIQRVFRRQPNSPVIWYDEGKTIYSRELLTDFDQPIQETFMMNMTEKTFQFKVLNLVRQEDTRNIQKFIERGTSIHPRECLHIVETLFKQKARNDLVNIRNQYYDRNQTLADLGK